MFVTELCQGEMDFGLRSSQYVFSGTSVSSETDIYH
jgi:hypothetical protein